MKMEKSTKKKLLVVLSLGAIAGIGYYLYKKRSVAPVVSTPDASSSQNSSTSSTNSTVAKASIQTAKAQLVSAVDLLAGNPNGVNQKTIYAKSANVPIRNAKGDVVRKSKLNEMLGVATGLSNGMIRFIGPDTIAYQVTPYNVNVKIN